MVSDDIVTRLRGYDFMRDGDIPDVIMSDAADEIERLRADRDHYEEQAKRWRTEALLNAAYPRTKPDEQG